MFIEVVDVVREDKASSNGKGTYGVLTVTYRSNGKIAEKKLMSFTNPTVFKHFEKATKGDQIDVTSVKNDKTGYWDWTAIGSGDAPAATQAQVTATPTRVTGSNYETKEERAAKQRYIVKQSSLSAAIAILNVGAKSPPSAKDVIALADEFVNYVFDESAVLELGKSLDNDDDIVY
jgi:hypothetical protein